MSEAATGYRKAAVERVLHGDGETSREARAAAFANDNVADNARGLVDKIAKTAWKVTDEDVKAAQQAGLSDDEIFELAVCAALGQATRQLETALDAVDRATQETP